MLYLSCRLVNNNLSIFRNMNAVFLAALQDFFSNGSTADLIVVDTFKMGCHEGCPRGIVHGLHNIRNVHDDAVWSVGYLSAETTTVGRNQKRTSVHQQGYKRDSLCFQFRRTIPLDAFFQAADGQDM